MNIRPPVPRGLPSPGEVLDWGDRQKHPSKIMNTFLKDEDGVFVNLATVRKIRREDPYRRPSEEAPWIAETKNGREHRFLGSR